jgi:hypothetical protein
MLRILLDFLACSNALAATPSSTPVMQPLSMQKRLQTLLHCPSRSALADVLHGPPDACPAYLRAVHLLIVFGTIYMHLKLLAGSLENSLYKSSFMKDLATRCSLHFCKMQSLGCEHACLIFGQAIPSASIVGAINGLNAVLFYVPVIAWIVGS